MQLQSARRIGRRVQRLRQGKQCAVYYWGMQLQSARRIGRRVQRLRQGKQCAVYSKEVWKILPSYEELRRGAIGRGKEAEVMSIRCHVN